MMYLRNTQRVVPINIERVRSDLASILTIIEYSDFDLSVWFTTEKTIQGYNHRFRSINRPTDVLSFPYHTKRIPGKRISVDNPDDKNLGDIIVAPLYIQKHLSDWNQPFEERLRVLLVHSICHLLGYDHINDDDYRIMQRKERAILKAM